MKSAEPLSASTMPCFLSARRITWFCGREAADVVARLEPEPRAHRRVGRTAASPPCGSPARRRRLPSAVR